MSFHIKRRDISLLSVRRQGFYIKPLLSSICWFILTIIMLLELEDAFDESCVVNSFLDSAHNDHWKSDQNTHEPTSCL